jgi:hypothetical protein
VCTLVLATVKSILIKCFRHFAMVVLSPGRPEKKLFKTDFYFTACLRRLQNLVTTAVCTHTTKFTFRRYPCVHTVQLCMCTHCILVYTQPCILQYLTAVDLCVQLYTQLCVFRVIVTWLRAEPAETGRRFTVPMLNFNCIL